METLYEITKAEFTEQEREVVVPAYTNDIVSLRFDLRNRTRSKDVTLEFRIIKRDYSKFKALRGDGDAFKIDSKFKQGGKAISSNILSIVNSVEWIDSIEERNMWLNALVQAEAWGNK